MSSNPNSLREQAEVAYRTKNYQEAARLYSEYLDEVGNPKGDMSFELCNAYIRYATSLIEVSNSSDKNSPKENDLDIAIECLEIACAQLEKTGESEEERKRLVDVYQLLGETFMDTWEFAEAAKNYEKSVSLCEKIPSISWNIHLNGIFMQGLCYDYTKNHEKAIEILNKAVEYIDQRKLKEESSTVAEMESIKQEILDRINH